MMKGSDIVKEDKGTLYKRIIHCQLTIKREKNVIGGERRVTMKKTVKHHEASAYERENFTAKAVPFIAASG